MNPLKPNDIANVLSSSTSSNQVNQNPNTTNTGLISKIINIALSILTNSEFCSNSQNKELPHHEKIGQMTERERKACEDYSKAYQKIEQYKWEQKQKMRHEADQDQGNNIEILTQMITDQQNEIKNLKQQVEEINREKQIEENIKKTKPAEEV